MSLDQSRLQERIALSPQEVARASGLSRKAVYRAIAIGELKAVRVCGGSRLLVPVEAARTWLGAEQMPPERGPQDGPLEPARTTNRPLFGAFQAVRENAGPDQR